MFLGKHQETDVGEAFKTAGKGLSQPLFPVQGGSEELFCFSVLSCLVVSLLSSQCGFCVHWFAVRSTPCQREGTAGGELRLRGRDDVTCLQCGNTHAMLHFNVQTTEQSHSHGLGVWADTVLYVNKQLRKYILSFHVESGGSHEHGYTNTHTRIYHSFPCGQPHLEGNGLESDTEQFVTPCLSHHECTVCMCVSVFIWALLLSHHTTTYYGVFLLVWTKW